MSEDTVKPTLKLMVVITDRTKSKKLTEILRNKGVIMFFVFNAIGSASSEILDLLGLNDSEKLIALCLQPCFRMQAS